MQSGEGLRHSEHFPFLAAIEVLPEWELAAARFLKLGGIAMVLGAADTGKSTFSRYLIYRAYLAGEPVALVDLDLGQSHLGPPATLGLGLFPPRRPGDDGLFPEGWYFIGDTSPVGSFLEVAVGCHTLVDQAARRGVSRVVVNTNGLVQGPAAIKLKRAQVELLNPSLILALERDQELEPLLSGLGWMAEKSSPLHKTTGGVRSEGKNDLPGWTLVRLPVSSRVVPRSPQDRRRYREERFRRYFHQARRLTLPWRSLIWEGLPGEPEPPLSGATQEEFTGNLGVCGASENSRAGPPGPLPAEEFQAASQPDLKTPAAEGTAPQFFWGGLQLRLVGLLSATRRTLALGLILPSAGDPEMVALWTPLPSEAAHQVHFVKVGKLTLNLEGRELSHV